MGSFHSIVVLNSNHSVRNKMKTFFILACLAVAYGADKNREGRLFLVSSSTSTTTLKTSTICFTTNTAITAACAGRKKRTILDNPMDTIDYEVNPVSRETREADVASSQMAETPGKNREGKYLLYWMTSTSTTTTTSYSSTVTLSKLECTPSNFLYKACGK